MYLKKISLENFRCFEKVEVDLQKKLTLVVGANGAGKTSLLESIAIAMSTMFTAFDGAKAMNITKESAHLKAYKIGSTDNVQPQYPVRIGAWAQLDERQEIYWERTLNTAKGKTTIVLSKISDDIGYFPASLCAIASSSFNNLQLLALALLFASRLL